MNDVLVAMSLIYKYPAQISFWFWKQSAKMDRGLST